MVKIDISSSGVLTVRRSKMMVGRRSFPLLSGNFSGANVLVISMSNVLQVAPKVSDKKDEAVLIPPKRRFGEYRKGNPPKNAQTLPNRLMSYSAIPKLTWIHVTN